MTLWFVEGLPGVGKTTLAENLCALVRKSGRAAVWYLEESIDHPVHGQSLKLERKNGGGFVSACLDSWYRFAERAAKDPVIHVLEGSAFQSTVRFMMEEELSGIDKYYTRFEEIVTPLAARMVYLRPKEAIEHSIFTSQSRGEVWTGLAITWKRPPTRKAVAWLARMECIVSGRTTHSYVTAS